MREEKEERQDLKRTTKRVKRLLHSKIRELDNRESQLFLKFLATQPEAVLKLDALELVWTFIKFLEASGLSYPSREYRLLHAAHQDGQAEGTEMIAKPKLTSILNPIGEEL